MKKYIYTAVLTLIVINSIHAQRMLPKQKGLEFNLGALSTQNMSRNYYLNVGMAINGKNGNYGLFALEYTYRFYPYKNIRIPLETFTAEGGYSVFLLGDAGKNIALNAALTGVAGYETINRGEAMLSDGAKLVSKDNFIYGVGGRLSFETYLSDHFVLLLQGRIKAFWGTDMERFRPGAGVGLRINF